MNYEVIIRSEAEKEISNAFDWYENQVPGLGSEFILAVDAVIQSIFRNPLQYPVVYKSIRRALTHRFPYLIFYIFENDQIVILAVFHARRDPGDWQKRR